MRKTIPPFLLTIMIISGCQTKTVNYDDIISQLEWLPVSEVFTSFLRTVGVEEDNQTLIYVEQDEFDYSKFSDGITGNTTEAPLRSIKMLIS